MHGYTQVVDTATENEIENDSCDSLGSSSQPPTDFTPPSGTEFDDIKPYVSEVAPIPLFDGSTFSCSNSCEVFPLVLSTPWN